MSTNGCKELSNCKTTHTLPRIILDSLRQHDTRLNTLYTQTTNVDRRLWIW